MGRLGISGEEHPWRPHSESLPLDGRPDHSLFSSAEYRYVSLKGTQGRSGGGDKFCGTRTWPGGVTGPDLRLLSPRLRWLTQETVIQEWKRNQAAWRDQTERERPGCWATRIRAGTYPSTCLPASHNCLLCTDQVISTILRSEDLEGNETAGGCTVIIKDTESGVCAGTQRWPGPRPGACTLHFPEHFLHTLHLIPGTTQWGIIVITIPPTWWRSFGALGKATGPRSHNWPKTQFSDSKVPFHLTFGLWCCHSHQNTNTKWKVSWV